MRKKNKDLKKSIASCLSKMNVKSFGDFCNFVESLKPQRALIETFLDAQKIKVNLTHYDGEYLHEIPSVYAVISCKSENHREFYATLYTYKRTKIKCYEGSLPTDTHLLLEIFDDLGNFKACCGYESDIIHQSACAEIFNDKRIFRHSDCDIVIGTDESENLCHKCESMTKRIKPPKPLVKGNIYSCADCDVEFKSKILLQQHFRRKHTQKRYHCKFECCNKSFLRKDTLKMHLSTHDPESFVCEECGAKFTRRSTMESHQKRLHESSGNDAAKNWSCADCVKMFYTRQQLERHRRIHLGEKPYKCQECQKAFTRSHHLVRHTKAQHAPNEEVSEMRYELVDEEGKRHSFVQIIPFHGK